MRVLVCAAMSIALIVAGTLVMDWYRMSIDLIATETGKISIDLRAVHICPAPELCTSAPLQLMPGMYPPLATATLWMSLAFAAFVALQTTARLLTGNASESLTKLGYVLALMAISIVIGAAYMFGPEAEDPGLTITAQFGGGVLHRSWAPATLIFGLIAGVAALYVAVAPDFSDSDEYKPVTLQAAPGAPRARVASGPMPVAVARRPTAQLLAVERPLEPPPPRADRRTGQVAAERLAADPAPAGGRTMSGPVPAAGYTTGPMAPVGRAMGPLSPLRATGSIPPLRGTSGPIPAARTTGSIPPLRSTTGSIAPLRAETSTLPPVPEHLRNRLSYVAITAELTGGGIDARREDGSSRLVLWRDVVGVVVRRLPAVYDAAVFVDIVSLAGSTLRLVPWTRLIGVARHDSDDTARSRAIVEYIIGMAPGARLDPATRHFMSTGEAAQLPDLDSLRAHDAHLA